MKRTQTDWARILLSCGVAPATLVTWAPAFADVVQASAFSKGDEDILDFLPEILHESGMLTKLEENLNYSAQRLTVVWPSRFPTLASAIACSYQPERLANTVYAGRLGNTEPGDGWRFRGRGVIQITGRENYRKVGALIGQDLIGIPDLLSQPRFSLEACIAWWEDKIPDSMLGETSNIRARVNGGTIGLDEIKRLTARVKEALYAGLA